MGLQNNVLVTEEKTIQIMELASENALIYFMNRIIDPIFPKDSPDIVLIDEAAHENEGYTKSLTSVTVGG